MQCSACMFIFHTQFLFFHFNTIKSDYCQSMDDVVLSSLNGNIFGGNNNKNNEPGGIYCTQTNAPVYDPSVAYYATTSAQISKPKPKPTDCIFTIENNKTFCGNININNTQIGEAFKRENNKILYVNININKMDRILLYSLFDEHSKMELISGTFTTLKYTLFIGIYIVLCDENNNKNKNRSDGMKKMLNDNNFVRHLAACETMGNETMVVDYILALTKIE